MCTTWQGVKGELEDLKLHRTDRKPMNYFLLLHDFQFCSNTICHHLAIIRINGSSVAQPQFGGSREVSGSRVSFQSKAHPHPEVSKVLVQLPPFGHDYNNQFMPHICMPPISELVLVGVGRRKWCQFLLGVYTV